VYGKNVHSFYNYPRNDIVDTWFASIYAENQVEVIEERSLHCFDVINAFLQFSNYGICAPLI
jgi:hypothetical protein